jgi:hypothetical protein
VRSPLAEEIELTDANRTCLLTFGCVCGVPKRSQVSRSLEPRKPPAAGARETLFGAKNRLAPKGPPLEYHKASGQLPEHHMLSLTEPQHPSSHAPLPIALQHPSTAQARSVRGKAGDDRTHQDTLAMIVP